MPFDVARVVGLVPVCSLLIVLHCLIQSLLTQRCGCGPQGAARPSTGSRAAAWTRWPSTRWAPSPSPPLCWLSAGSRRRCGGPQGRASAPGASRRPPTKGTAAAEVGGGVESGWGHFDPLGCPFSGWALGHVLNHTRYVQEEIRISPPPPPPPDQRRASGVRTSRG